MSSKFIIDPGSIDLENTLYGPEEIRARNSQRFEMEMLDRIVHFDPENATIAGIHVVREDAFWSRGHFPDRPILPGVLMIETAGQLCSFYYGQAYNSDEIIGFAACEEVRFRGVVRPGSELLMIGEMVALRTRLAKFSAQGYVDGEHVFEGTIVGMKL
ncbi:MAG: 3-hydroxyacyl-ACP dehydratase FabZ family protein [Planctomycetota bacterium]|nr:3-hydroxyacyl-ACP dehydratase FabZ family protein [Planctomycetota bacterium]